ncbi:hypothetical protein J2Z83_003714 [Virgibacillus natechei]|uniref:YopX protein domain-containing protein n=1 Tax=Virgibacillus natechei TaxID=1216297 RepID=A0ABS4IKS4_9BACI|nr:hypothetical protein [Virgibacillus natechei]MBP1971563.1 hypothetical protein [Virgibacillus natechei]UZD13101.1 hypothetical protein OLD84_00550 [Virgibacillus natechei]
MTNFKNVGTWWNDKDIDLVEIDGTVYALHGWNGEKFNNCWICTGEYNMVASEEEFEIEPIYSDDEDMDIIGYEVA